MDTSEIEKIRQIIDKLSQQINHLEASMSVDILSKGVLKKEEICNLLIRIADHKSLIEQLETDINDTLGVEVKRITNSLNVHRKISS